ncbi:MAG: DUF2203 domain-containing protein [Candidatus Zixiibacteriota bacterium]
MAQFAKHFTLAEANAMLPQIRAIFEQIAALRAQLAERQGDLALVHRAAPGNGGDPNGSELVIQSETIGRLLHELEQNGVIVQDPEAGIIDFPHIRDGEEIFLCWRSGEESVSHWHHLDTGFRGRKPIT